MSRRVRIYRTTVVALDLTIIAAMIALIITR
jgi:hypothetical protein